MLGNHLAGQEINLVAEVTELLAVDPEDSGHTHVGKITEVEIEDPEVARVKLRGDGIAKPPEHVVIGLLGLLGLELAGGIVEVGVGVGLDGSGGVVGLDRGFDLGRIQAAAELACQRHAGCRRRTGNQLSTTHSILRF